MDPTLRCVSEARRESLARESYIIRLMERTNIPNKDLRTVLNNLNACRLFASYCESDLLKIGRNFQLFHIDYSTRYYINSGSFSPIYPFVDKKHYIQKYINQHLGINSEMHSRLYLEIASFGSSVKSFPLLGEILDGILNVTNSTIFIDYTNQLGYDNFCIDMLLNLLRNPLGRKQYFNTMVILFMLAYRNFMVKDILVTETVPVLRLFSVDSEIRALRLLYLLNNQQKEFLLSVFTSCYEELIEVVSNNMPKEVATSTKANITRGFTTIKNSLTK